MYQALYRKYRPKTLNEVGGQDTIVKIINNSITNNKISHAYLFAGPRGTGKTSIAKIFAKMVNCENIVKGIPCNKCVSCTQTSNSDIIEIDAASNNGVDEIRELRNKVNLVPSYGKYKVYIIDEVHMLTTGAFNALLKTLEEPPAHVIFILATTDPHKIPETILSRCQRLDFKKISENSLVNRLTEISQAEKIDVDEEALKEIARLSDGGMRDSIGMLDQAIAYADGEITVSDIHDINGTLTTDELKQLIDLIGKGDLENVFKKIDYYNDSGKNFVKLTEEIITFMRNILLCGKAPSYFKTKTNNIEVYQTMVDNISSNQILDYIDKLNGCLSEMKMTNNTKLLLELAIIRMLGKKEIEKKESDIEKKEVEAQTQAQPKNKVQPEQKTVEKSEEKPIDNPQVQSMSIEPPAQEKPGVKTSQTANFADKETLEKFKKIKQIRIDNTLAKFNKRSVMAISQKLIALNDYLLDPEISKYASVILDGTLKAASENNLIFVYKNERTANLFNENVINIEQTLEKILTNKYQVIATDINDWEKIKNEFNSKTKQYVFKEEPFKIEDLFQKKEENDEFKIFEDIIEYN